MKSFVCEGCPKEFARRDVLLNHQRGQYGGEEKVKDCLFHLWERIQ